MLSYDEIYKITKITHNVILGIREFNKENDLIHWDKLKDEDKENYIRLTQQLLAVENNMSDPEKTHKVWCDSMINLGWKYGMVTDRKNKIHNCLISYEELDIIQKIKDVVYINIIKELIELNSK